MPWTTACLQRLQLVRLVKQKVIGPGGAQLEMLMRMQLQLLDAFRKDLLLGSLCNAMNV
jgi:hypothetical protein